jgi:enoyl-CoA hydratase
MPVDRSIVAPHVLLVTLDRPERRNALDLAHFRELAAAWRLLAEDDELRVAVVTGIADVFCAGADLSSFASDVASASGGADGKSGVARAWADINAALLRDSPLDKPVVAAVNGACIGAGMELLGATDIRVAARSARFALPEVRRGIVASGGSLARLVRQIPYALAMEMLLTGEGLPADRMLAAGAVNDVVDGPDTLGRAVAIASRIALNSPLAVRATKRAVIGGLRTDLGSAFELEAATAREVLRAPDAAEGARAFLRRRPPRWQ